MLRQLPLPRGTRDPRCEWALLLVCRCKVPRSGAGTCIIAFLLLFEHITYLGAQIGPKFRLAGRAVPSPEWVCQVEVCGAAANEPVASRARQGPATEGVHPRWAPDTSWKANGAPARLAAGPRLVRALYLFTKNLETAHTLGDSRSTWDVAHDFFLSRSRRRGGAASNALRRWGGKRKVLPRVR